MNQYYQKDLYAILGVEPDADIIKIKSAYRKQARIWHPDVNDNSQESILRFKEITEAYEVLTDSHKRSQYDILKGFNTRKESFYTSNTTKSQAKKAYNETNSSYTQTKTEGPYNDIVEIPLGDWQLSLTDKVMPLGVAGRMSNGNFCGPMFHLSTGYSTNTVAKNNWSTRLDYRSIK